MENTNEMTTKTTDNMMSVAQNLVYCSFQANTPAGKIKLFNAKSNPDDRIANHINKEIEISDIYAEMIELPDEETGEMVTCPRIILIDKTGKSFVAVSQGIYTDIKSILQIFGQPVEWEKPLTVQVKQVAVKSGSMLKLQVI